MGKRELVLVMGFLLLGIATYQLTAPPPPPGSAGFSLGGLLRNIRRNVKGPRETATADSSQTAVVPEAISLLRLSISRPSDVTITGEDRDDVSASLHVTGRGFDQSEAAAAAKAPKIRIEPSADAVNVSLDLAGAPSVTGGQPAATLSLTLLVPKRLAVRAEPHIGRFILANVAGADIVGSRGDTKISNIAKDVRLTHNGGALDLANIAALKLTARSSRGAITSITGALTIDAISGDLRLSGITGPVDLDARNTDVTLEADAALKPPLRMNVAGGQVRVRGLSVETRIDARNSDVSVALDAPAPVTIYNVGAIAVTAPPGGYTLDAVATEGHITSEDSAAAETTGDSPDARMSQKVRGGGPPLTLRATHGRIEVRKPAGK